MFSSLCALIFFVIYGQEITAKILQQQIFLILESEVMPWQNSNMQWCHLVDKWFDQVAQMFASITAAQIICSYWLNGLFVKISSGCASYNFGAIDFNKD